MADTKPSSQLLSEIQASDSKVLKDVTTVENPAAKHDMAMVRVTNVMNVTKRDTVVPLSRTKFLIFQVTIGYNLSNFSSELPSLTRTSSKLLRLSRRMFCPQPTISRKKRVTKYFLK